MGSLGAQSPPQGSDAGAVWVAVAGHGDLVKLAGADGQALLAVDVPKVRAVAAGTDRIWTAGRDIRVFGFDGQLAFSRAFPSEQDDDDESGEDESGEDVGDEGEEEDHEEDTEPAIALDLRDGSAWVSKGHSVLHLDREGVLLQTVTLSKEAFDLAFDPGRDRLWVGSHKAVFAHDARSGAVAASLVLPKGEVADIDVDPESGAVVVAAGENVVRYDPDSLLGTKRTLKNVHRVAAARDGTIWVSAKKRLQLLRADLAPVVTVELGKEVVELASDPTDGSAWAAMPKKVTHVSKAGQVLVTTEIEDRGRIRALSVAGADVTPPLLSFGAFPQPGSFLATLMPELSVSYTDGPAGSGVDPTTLEFRLFGQPLATVCTYLPDGATCQPTGPLVEGPAEFSVTVRDRAGLVSAPADLFVTLDVTPPAVVVTSPAEGFLTSTTPVTFTGSVNEPVTLTIAGQPAAVGLDGSFQQSVPLAEGPNQIEVVASDRAGLLSSVLRTVHLDTVPPAPVAAANVFLGESGGAFATVTGDPGACELGATVEIRVVRTGEVFTTTANAQGGFVLTVNAAPGEELVLTIVDAAGNRSTPMTFRIPTGPAVPPDPATLAPEIPGSVVTDIFSANSFLFSGPNAIQQGVSPGTIEPRRITILRGRVLDRAGAGVPGVRVSAVGADELGFTMTRADGFYELCANGGGEVVLSFRSPSFIEVQRRTPTSWRKWTVVDDVVLSPFDAQATVVDLSGGATGFQVARGSENVDADGARRVTLLFPPGVAGELRYADQRREPLPSASLRVTELTVGPQGPAAMPLSLSPPAQYTFAFDVSAEEARDAVSIELSGPVPIYLENFLGIPNGMPVPVGSLDRASALWVAEEDGFVLEVVSIDGGIATLSVDAAGLPADDVTLETRGITIEERMMLAQLYAPGDSLWRVAVHHFTAWDLNFPCIFIAGLDDTPQPNESEPFHAKSEPESCLVGGSVIECENQNLREIAPLAGTATSLRYQSARTQARTGIEVGLTTKMQSLPTTMRSITVSLDVEGRREKREFAPQTGLRTTFTWDGQDPFGRRVQGARPATVEIVYEGAVLEYGIPGLYEFGRRSFSVPAALATRVQSRTVTVQRTQKIETSIGGFDDLGRGLGGLSLSDNHVFSPDESRVHLGSGESRGASEVDRVVETVAGNGLLPTLSACATPGVCDDAPGPSVRVNPTEIAPAPDGSVFFIGGLPGIRRLRPDGIVERWTSDTAPQLTSGCAPGRDVGALGAATPDVAFGPVGPDGALYVAGTGRISRLDLKTGMLCVIAGTGSTLFSGDHGPALSAGLSARSLAVAPDGSLWFHDVSSLGSRIRRIGPDGFIRTIAGGATLGNGGDGGAALQAQLGSFPIRLLGFAPDGSFFFWDIGTGPGTFFPRIRRIDVTGQITTYAGNGGSGRGADGSLARLAPVNVAAESGLALDGSIVFNDGGAVPRQIRRIRPDGRLETIAGHPTVSGFSPDGSPARQMSFGVLTSVKVAPDGDIYFIEDRRIRRLRPAIPGFANGDVSIVSPSGSELYRFNAAGQHLETRDTLTGTVQRSFSYDPEGLLIATHDANGNATQIERGPDGALVAIVAPGGQRTGVTLDASGRASTITNPAGETTRFDWQADGLLRSVTNPRGHRTEFVYGTLGALVLERDPAGGSHGFVRTGERPDYSVTRTTALGRATRYRVEDLATKDQRRTITLPDGTTSTLLRQANEGRVRTRSDGTTIVIERKPDPRFGLQSPLVSSRRVSTPGGRVSLTTASRAAALSDPTNPMSLQSLSESVVVNGRPYTSSFDGASRTSVSITPEGRQASALLDAQGRVTRSQGGTLAPVSYVYDALGRLSEMTAGEGLDARRFQFEYDAANRLVAVTDPLLRTTRFSHDEAGRVIEQIFPDGGISRATYDANGNVTSLAPPDRPAHRFSYTPVDLEATYEAPLVPGGGSHLTVSGYDPDRAPTLETRPDGTTVLRRYDSAGRLSSLEHAFARLDYSYHPTTGRLASIAATGAGTLTFGFDGPLPTSESTSGPLSGSVVRTFDNDFRLTTETVNGAFPARYSYDLDGLLVAAGDLTLSRDAGSGLLTGSQLGAVTEAREHNAFGEPTRVAYAALGVPLLETLYDRDKLGRITRKTETIEGVTTVTEYGYDAAGRLETVIIDGVLAATYSWDRNGNRLSAATSAGTALANYDDQDRLLSHGDATFTYTAAGELATKTDASGTTSYRYDPLGNLRRVDLPDGRVIEYVIDGRNRRVGKMVNGVPVQGFLYRDQLEPIAETDGAGNIVARFVYGTRAHAPDYMIKGGATYRIVSDHLGSPRLVVDAATGAVVQRMDFDEWGNVTLDTAPGFQPFGFAGGLSEIETGLVRFGSRDYFPELGRWTTQDRSWVFGIESNRFAYQAGNPVNYVDASGDFTLVEFVVVVTGVVIFVTATILTVDYFATYNEAQRLATQNLPPTATSDDRSAYTHCYGGCRATNSWGSTMAGWGQSFHEWIEPSPDDVLDNFCTGEGIFYAEHGLSNKECAKTCMALTPYPLTYPGANSYVGARTVGSGGGRNVNP